MEFGNVMWCIILICMSETSESRGKKKSTADSRDENEYETVNITSNGRPMRVQDRLYGYLFNSYNNNLRPVLDESTAIKVLLAPILFSLVDLDEQKSSIQLITWRTTQWTDELLRWNPDDFGGITKLKVPATKIWMPDIAIYNAIDIEAHTVATDDTEDDVIILVNYNGTLRTSLLQRFTVRCDSMDLRHFPFDTQSCHMRYGLFRYHTGEVTLDILWDIPSMMANNKSRSHPEWKINSYNGTKSQDHYFVELEGGNITHDDIYFSIDVSRKHAFYTYTIAVPTLIITALGLIGLFTPVSNKPERNEKVSFGSAILLAHVVMLLILGEGMPRDTTSQPRLGNFIIFEMAYMMCATVVTIVELHFHGKALTHGWTPPKTCIKWLSWRKQFDAQEAKQDDLVMSMKRKDDRQTVSEGREFIVRRLCNAADVATTTDLNPDIVDILRSIQRNLHRIQANMLTQEEDNALELAWQDFFQATDYLLLVVFSLVHLLVSFFLYFQYTFEQFNF